MVQKTILAAVSTFALMMSAAYATPKVTTSIKPVHSLVSAVMKGVGTPDLIVTGAGSPHSYALKPSQAVLLEKAELIFWIGHEFETFLEKPVETIGGKAKSVELIDSPGLEKLEQREGGAFGEHDEDHDHGHDHGDEKLDLHFWLDPENAKAMTSQIANTLIAADPENANRYKVNSMATLKKLDALIKEVSADLALVKGEGFVVFHDGYQYFEKRFGLSAAGSITINPEISPGPQRVREIRTRIGEVNAQCVFAEPQFDAKLIAVVTEGTEMKSGVIDPLGATLKDGAELYFNLIRNMAKSIRGCLS